jgi:hypothetical protein
MKKLALILALMLIPCTAFGLEMLNDTTLDSVTGQAGVDIAMDDIQIFMNIEKMAWIDCDGYGSLGRWDCEGSGGAMVLNNFQMDMLNINAITASVAGGTTTLDLQLGPNLGLRSVACGKIALFYNYATAATTGCLLNSGGGQTLGIDNFTYGQALWTGNNALFVNSRNFTPNFLSIDVTDELPAATDGLNSWFANSYTSAAVDDHGGDGASTIGGVLIGLPTAEFYINSMSFEPLYDGDIGGATTNAINDDGNTWLQNGQTTYASFGTIEMQGITFTVLSGWIEIAPH